MYVLLKYQYEIYGAGVKPVQASGMHWIDNRLKAIYKM